MILNYLILKLCVLIDFAGCNKQSNICVEYVDAFLQVIQDVCEIGIQTHINEYENKGDYNNYYLMIIVFSINIMEIIKILSKNLYKIDFDIYGKSHKKIIIQKDSEIIVLENELEV
jgi:ABC-type anion transport system duplicated permease subunit